MSWLTEFRLNNVKPQVLSDVVLVQWCYKLQGKQNTLVRLTDDAS